MRRTVQIYMVLRVYKSIFLGWVVGRYYIAVNGEHNCGVPPEKDQFNKFERQTLSSSSNYYELEKMLAKLLRH